MSRKTNLVVAAAATAAALLAAGCGSGKAQSAAQAAPAARSAAPARAAAAPPTSSSPTPSAKTGTAPGSMPRPYASIDPGTLPQTHTLPGDQDAQFQAGAQALWRAIVQDRPELARPFFFPLTAYRQVKAISDPDGDYQSRLITWYDLDIKAAHDHLGPNAANAKFVRMQVPEANAEWIEPGVEYNKGSYYRVYGTRLNYQINGHQASIGVFSLISWRGEWYVVHLGPSTRDATEGIVYDPSN